MVQVPAVVVSIATLLTGSLLTNTATSISSFAALVATAPRSEYEPPMATRAGFSPSIWMARPVEGDAGGVDDAFSDAGSVSPCAGASAGVSVGSCGVDSGLTSGGGGSASVKTVGGSASGVTTGE